MNKKLKQAAHRKRLADETGWQRKKREMVESFRQKPQRIKEFFKKWDDTIRVAFGLCAMVALALFIVWLALDVPDNSYMILSGDRCWIVDRYHPNGEGTIYFDIAHGRIILTEYEAIRIKNDEEHDFLATVNTMGYSELDLDTCYQDEE